MCGGEVGDTGADPTGDTTGDPTGEGTGARITAMDGITDTVRIPDAGGTAGAGYFPRGESLFTDHCPDAEEIGGGLPATASLPF